MSAPQSNIVHVILIKPCIQGKKSYTIFPTANLNLWDLAELALPSLSSRMLWNIFYIVWGGDKSIAHMVDFILSCNKRPQVNETQRQRIGQQHAKLWMHIMKNYTTFLGADTTCMNGVEDRSSPKLRQLRPNI